MDPEYDQLYTGGSKMHEVQWLFPHTTPPVLVFTLLQRLQIAAHWPVCISNTRDVDSVGVLGCVCSANKQFNWKNSFPAAVDSGLRDLVCVYVVSVSIRVCVNERVREKNYGLA